MKVKINTNLPFREGEYWYYNFQGYIFDVDVIENFPDYFYITKTEHNLKIISGRYSEINNVEPWSVQKSSCTILNREKKLERILNES